MEEMSKQNLYDCKLKEAVTSAYIHLIFEIFNLLNIIYLLGNDL